MNPMRGMGLSLARLNAAHVDIGVRQGGERMRLTKNGVHRSLKNLLQESALPLATRVRAAIVVRRGNWCGQPVSGLTRAVWR